MINHCFPNIISFSRFFLVRMDISGNSSLSIIQPFLKMDFTSSIVIPHGGPSSSIVLSRGNQRPINFPPGFKILYTNPFVFLSALGVHGTKTCLLNNIVKNTVIFGCQDKNIGLKYLDIHIFFIGNCFQRYYC